MTVLDTSEMEKIAARHPEIFRQSPWSRYRVPVGAAAAALYLVFCWWFFSIGHVLGAANWSIAGSYLASWVSYEVRPDVKIAPDRTMKIVYPRFSPLGPNPHPDWLTAKRQVVTRSVEIPATAEKPAAQPQQNSAITFMTPGAALGESAAKSEAHTETVTEEIVTQATVQMNSVGRVEILPDRVTLIKGEEKVVVPLGSKSGVKAETPLTDWATQKRPGDRIIASYGVSGWVEVEGDTVKIRKRFFGWANFIFDTNSPFFDKPLGEVASLIASGERIDPKQSNLALAWDNILYNAEWQHLDVWTKLLQTVVMAFVGTLFAAAIAFPLSFLAARNITRNRFSNQLLKRFFDFQRSVDMFIWALFFTRAFGPGPLAGISAIFFTDTGTLGKLYSEALENIDDKQREGVKSVGAPAAAVQRFGVMPQVMPLFASQALYFWESNTRSATIIGAVGAGGIGLKLWEAMRTNSNWANVAYMVLLILIVVFIFDAVSNSLRARLMGTKH